MLIWVDLETTGLIPNKDLILEVAAIATDDQLNELSRFHVVSGEIKRCQLAEVDPFVIEMHANNGLWIESMKSSHGVGRIDVEMSRWVAGLMTGRTPDFPLYIPYLKNREDFKTLQPQLAGSTIGFDREFMRYHLPLTLELLNYRNLDVSSINEMAKRFWPAVWEGRPKGDTAHRAMADIEASLAVAKYYAQYLGESLGGLE